MTVAAPKLALFLDIETTGLDPITDQIMEIGFSLVDTDTWTAIREKAGLIYTPQLRYRLDNDLLNEYVRDMHTKSGLLAEIMEVHEASTSDQVHNYKDYEERIIETLDSWGVNRANPSWGSSVHFDRKFLGSKMPKLNELMHYRIVDSSSDMERIKLRYPKMWKKIDEDPTKYAGGEYGPDHRVLEDIHHSIDLERRLDKWVYRPAASCADIGVA